MLKFQLPKKSRGKDRDDYCGGAPQGRPGEKREVKDWQSGRKEGGPVQGLEEACAGAKRYGCAHPTASGSD